jgi:hypothetical protein
MRGFGRWVFMPVGTIGWDLHCCKFHLCPARCVALIKAFPEPSAPRTFRAVEKSLLDFLAGLPRLAASFQSATRFKNGAESIVDSRQRFWIWKPGGNKPNAHFRKKNHDALLGPLIWDVGIIFFRGKKAALCKRKCLSPEMIRGFKAVRADYLRLDARHSCGSWQR